MFQKLLAWITPKEHPEENMSVETSFIEIEDALMLVRRDGQALFPVIIHGPTQVVLKSDTNVRYKDNDQRLLLLQEFAKQVEHSNNPEAIDVAQWAAGDLRDKLVDTEDDVVEYNGRKFQRFTVELTDDLQQPMIFVAFMCIE